MRAPLIFLIGLFTLVHAGSARAQYGAGGWDSKGWVLLGERTINGHREHGDYIDVSDGHGRFGKVMIVVTDSEATLTDFGMTFARGDGWHPGLNKHFNDG